MSNFYLPRNHIFENTEFWVNNSEDSYCATVRRIIESKPFGDKKFYIFQFIKRVDDTTGVKKMYHVPRLTKPEPIPGGTLLRVDPSDPDTVTIMWTLPNQENFGLYNAGKMFADEFVHECIQKYKEARHEMIKPEPGDPSENEIREIYKGIYRESKKRKAKMAKDDKKSI